MSAAVAGSVRVPFWYAALGRVLEPITARAGQAGDRQAVRWRRGLDVPAASLWVHGASVGEAAGAAPLVAAILERHPEERALLSALTPGGRAALRRLLPSYAVVAPPTESGGAVRRALEASGARRLLLLETELWPAWLAGAIERGVRVAVANARLSDRSWPRTSGFRGWLRPFASRLTAVAAQTAIDAERWAALGVPEERLRVTGSTKFDVESSAPLDPSRRAEERAQARARLGIRTDGVWCVWASLRPGEERWLERAMVATRATELCHLVIPRHPDRWPPARRLGDGGEYVTWRAELGVLHDAYLAADFAVVGGTLEPYGGHNPIEAARAGVPVLLGPSLSNIREAAAALLSTGAARLVDDAEALAEAAATWTSDALARARAAAAAPAAVQRLRGASVRTVAWLEERGYWA